MEQNNAKTLLQKNLNENENVRISSTVQVQGKVLTNNIISTAVAQVANADKVVLDSWQVTRIITL